jgi:hypothetical protein
LGLRQAIAEADSFNRRSLIFRQAVCLRLPDEHDQKSKDSLKILLISAVEYFILLSEPNHQGNVKKLMPAMIRDDACAKNR